MYTRSAEETDGLENELALVLCTRSAQPGARARLASLAAAVDYEVFVRTVNRQRLLPLAGSRLLASLPEVPPVWFAERVQREVQLGRWRAMWFEAAISPLRSKLEEAGIPTVPLKGPWFAESVYGDPGVRPFSDADLLVMPIHLEAARKFLLAEGYDAAFEARWSGERPLLHEVLIPPAPDYPTIELHWRVHWYENSFAAGVVQRSVGSGTNRRAAAVDELAMMLLFLARDGLIGLRPVADLAAWWDRFGSELPPRPLAGLSRSHPALASAWRTSSRYLSRIAGTPDLVGTGGKLSLRESVAMRLSNWRLVGSDEQLVLDAKLVDLMLTPAGQAGRWLGRHVWPPREHIRNTYELNGAGAGEEALLRLKHATAITTQLLTHLAGIIEN